MFHCVTGSPMAEESYMIQRWVVTVRESLIISTINSNRVPNPRAVFRLICDGLYQYGLKFLLSGQD